MYKTSNISCSNPDPSSPRPFLCAMRSRADPLGVDNDDGFDDMETAGSRRARQQQHHDLLVPRGLDLLPSMRAPRRLPVSTMSNGGAADAKETAAGTIEYVPWIGGSANVGGVKAGKAGTAPVPAPATVGITDRVQWFPRGLPNEPTAAGGKGQDERESAMFNTRASMAIDRLGEQVEDTANRQAEMEIKRREKVKIAV